SGAIRAWGVSNFDIDDMEELVALQGGAACAGNQGLYNWRRRGIRAGVLPWCRERGMPIMAYSPIEQGRLLRDRALTGVAIRHRATAAEIALAWVLRHTDMMVIPKATTLEHVRENRAALDIALTEQDLAELNRPFPPPKGRRPLELLLAIGRLASRDFRQAWQLTRGCLPGNIRTWMFSSARAT